MGRAGHFNRRWRTSRMCCVAALAAASVIAAGVATAGTAAADPNPSCGGAICTISFAETGNPQSWGVPAGVSTVTITVAAAAGGASGAASSGGAGGQLVASIPVQWNENLTVVVGAAGTKGTSGGIGGYGGGADAGFRASGSGGGGGGSFVFDTTGTTTTLLLAAGGGGGAADSGQVPGTGGAGGPGTPASSTSSLTIGGGGASSAAGGDGGAGSAGTFSAGSPGSGPAIDAFTLGRGGGGGNDLPNPQTNFGGGGGGGYLGGGGGGLQDLPALMAGAGGGGSGLIAPNATLISTSTNAGDGSIQISYPVPVSTTTSGALLDATTGVPIQNGCVVFSPVADPGLTNYTNVSQDGTWSFSTDELGPFNLAFYTTANGDCSQPILPTPVPSWYTNQPLTGTDEHTITPPAASAAVTAGASGVLACLGANALPTAACVVPDAVMSGTIDTTGSKPLADVCVVLLDHTGNGIGATISDANGNWTITGLPHAFNAVLVELPDASDPNSPCAGNNNGPPPVPPAGALQPIFYNNVWVNLADPTLLNDPYQWAIAHGATILTTGAAGVDTCITTALGSTTPRPICSLPATTAGADAADAPLANTGTPTTPLLTTGAGLATLGTLLLLLTTRRRRAPCPSQLRASREIGLLRGCRRQS